jgi:hypothetical protein
VLAMPNGKATRNELSARDIATEKTASVKIWYTCYLRDPPECAHHVVINDAKYTWAILVPGDEDNLLNKSRMCSSDGIVCIGADRITKDSHRLLRVWYGNNESACLCRYKYYRPESEKEKSCECKLTMSVD